MSALIDPRQRLLNQLNIKNGRTMTLEQVSFGVPLPIDDGGIATAPNTTVPLYAKVGAPAYGAINVTYRRRDVNDYLKDVVPEGMLSGFPPPEGAPTNAVTIVASSLGISTVHELLIMLNIMYATGFLPEDFTDGPLPDLAPDVFAPLVLPLNGGSFQYTGTLYLQVINTDSFNPLSTYYSDTVLGQLPSAYSSVAPGGSAT